MTEPEDPHFINYQNQVRKWEMETQYNLNWRLESFKALIQFGLVGLRGVVLINGGAAIAVLTFLGHFVTTADPRIAGVATYIIATMAAFLVGTVAGVSAACASYVAQYFYSHGMTKSGVTAHIIAIGLTVAGLAAFCWGSATAARVFAGILSG